MKLPTLASLLSFVLLAAPALAAPPQYQPVPAELFHVRDGLGNIVAKLEAGQRVRIGYLGGSITAAPGWRVQTRTWLQQRYPQAQVEEIHAAIGGTGSDLGVFRLEHDLLRHQPDLVFVEFAVNDGGASPERIWQAMEGIVRQIWTHNAKTDICFIYTLHHNYTATLQSGECPRAAGADEMLAAHYGIPSINVALRVAELAAEGKVQVMPDPAQPENAGAGEADVILFSTDGVHPHEAGHQIYTDVIAAAWEKIAEASQPIDHGSKLAQPFVEDHWQAATLIPLAPAMLSGDWKELPSAAGLGKTFGNRLGTIFETSTPGAKLQFRFRGSGAMLYDLLGPDGGQVMITVDGQTRGPVPRFDSYCTYHRLATLPIANHLEANAEHTVTIELHPEQPDRSIVTDKIRDQAGFDPEKYNGTRLRVGAILLLGELVEP